MQLPSTSNLLTATHQHHSSTSFPLQAFSFANIQPPNLPEIREELCWLAQAES